MARPAPVSIGGSFRSQPVAINSCQLAAQHCCAAKDHYKLTTQGNMLVIDRCKLATHLCKAALSRCKAATRRSRPAIGYCRVATHCCWAAMSPCKAATHRCQLRRKPGGEREFLSTFLFSFQLFSILSRFFEFLQTITGSFPVFTIPLNNHGFFPGFLTSFQLF